MQITAKNHDSLSGALTIFSIPIDSTEMSLITAMLTVYTISGGGALTIQMQTSDDLETWKDFGSTFSRSAAGSALAAFTALGSVYQRYVRMSITLSGSSPLVTYSLWANLFPSA
jgi:hypothetical protein